MNCNYGCEKTALFKLKNGKHCCSSSRNKCEALRNKNSAGLRQAYADGRHPGYTFTDEDRQTVIRNQKTQAIKCQFTQKSSASNHYLKRLLTEEMGWQLKCGICGIVNWNNKPINVQLDHIDGNSSNNTVDNLRFLCPNCHSQTDTYCGKNVNKGLKKVSDDILKQALSKCKNVRQALMEAGLAPKGANYSRAYKLLNVLKESSDVQN
jgi:Zn finger protein HypA/HybF involved in hydrogenase expression